MRKQWFITAAVAAIMMIGFLDAFGADAQSPGPQGVGAEKAAQSSHAPRSYNPIKWLKKDPNTTTEKPKKTKNKKPAENTKKPLEKSATPDAPAKPEKA
jgi:hypothetical protein